MRVCLTGYYGKNLGDLMFLDLLNKHIIRSPSSSLDLIFSYGKELDEALWDILNKQGTQIVYSNDYGIFEKYIKLIKLFQKIDVVIWGGGSCFKNYKGGVGLVAFCIAFLMGKRIIYLGVGIEKITNLYPRIVLLVSYYICDSFILRDKESYSVLFRQISALGLPFKASKAHIIGDLSLLYNDNLEVVSENYLVVSFRDEDGKINGKNIINLIIQLIIKLDLNKVVILSIDSEKDLEFNRDIKNRVSSLGYQVELLLNENYYDKLSIMKRAKFVFTSRLHGALISYLFKIPFYVLDYSEKIRNMSKSFGFESRVLSMNFDAYELDINTKMTFNDLNHLKFVTNKMLDDIFI